MKTLESIIEELSLEETRQGYLELKEWHQTGMLEHGIIRRVHQEFITGAHFTSLQYGVKNVENTFLMEIAKRSFE